MVAAAAAGGCVQTDTARCGELLCAPGAVCVSERGECHDKEAADACDGQGSGSQCSLAGTAGRCDRGVCVPEGCGDGTVLGAEDCDGDALAGMTCLDLGYYAPDGLACDASCRFDTMSCAGTCGDDELNGPPGFEQCDGDVIDGATCLDIGADFGALGCDGVCQFDSADCGTLGFRAHNLGTSQPFAAIAATATGEVLAVGDDKVARFDGFAWTTVTVAGAELAAVATVADVVALAGTDGGAGAVWMRDAAGDFCAEPLPAVAALSHIALASPTEMHAAGPTVVLFFDGTAWTERDGPWAQGGDSVVAIAPAGGGSVYVFANSGGGATTAYLHDGSGATALDTLSPGVVTVAYHTGSDVFVGTDDGRIYRFDGAAFAPLIFTAIGQPVVAIAGDSDGLVIVRQTDDASSQVLFRDGLMFSQLDFDGPQITAAATRSPTDIWIAGAFGYVAEFDGAGTTTLDLAGNGGGAVFSSRAGGIFAANSGPLGHTLQRYLHPSFGSAGTMPSSIDTLDGIGGTVPDFDSVYGGGEGFLVRNTQFANTQLFLVPDADDKIRKVAAVDSTLGYAVSSERLYRMGDTDGSLIVDSRAIANPSEFDALFAAAADDVWLGGPAGYLARGNMTAPFAQVSPPIPEGLSGVRDDVSALWMTGPTDVYVGTGRGDVFHFDGTAWSLSFRAPFAGVVALDGTAADDVFVLLSSSGGLTPLFQYNGQRWAPIRVRPVATPSDLSVSSTSIAIASAGKAVPDVIARTGR